MVFLCKIPTLTRLNLYVVNDWINITMDDTSQKPLQNPNDSANTSDSKIDESGRLYVDDFLRIYDPNNQEIILEKRN